MKRTSGFYFAKCDEKTEKYEDCCLFLRGRDNKNYWLVKKGNLLTLATAERWNEFLAV